MASNVPTLRKGQSLPPTLLTPPTPEHNPATWKGKQFDKRLSYFDIRASSTVMNDSDDAMEQGLGINFYAEDKKAPVGDANSSDAMSDRESKVEAEVLAAAPSTSQGGGDAQAAQPQSPEHLDLQSPNFSNEPFDIHDLHDEHQIDLIEKLLEENYRGQAETFVRNSSQASVRSLSQTSSRSPSVASSSRTNRERNPSSVYTPTRKPSKGDNSVPDLLQTHHSLPSPSIRSFSLRTPSGANRVIVEPYQINSGSGRRHNRSSSRFTPGTSSHCTYSHRIYSVPRLPTNRPYIPKGIGRSSNQFRGALYFTSQERQAISELVHANPRECDRHPDCTDCHNLEYAYFENKAMPTSMPPEERQKIINNNRSLRNIKNELETLLENGVIGDAAYDTMMQALPAESSLNGPGPARSTAASPTPVPTASFSNLSVNDPPPPAYNNPTPPSLPGRSQSKPEISRATALYRYAEPGDCNFEVGDQISVSEYMNADWWLGRNLRTGQEGVFPVNYVQVQTNPNKSGMDSGMYPSPSQGYYGNEKTNGYGGYQPKQQQGPPPPGPSNPYNSAVPPMQIAEQPVESKPGKGQEMGKKFGKKLGNAAIFGAGATIGGNIVNSIF